MAGFMVTHTPLKRIGDWSSDLDGPELIHPVLLIAPEWRSLEKDRIVQYLKKGVRTGGALHWHKFRLNYNGTGDPNRLTSAEMSDGTYVWPEVLSIYVEQNHVRLPDEFVEHMARLDFDPLKDVIATGSDRDSLCRRGFDSLFWRTWCHGEKLKAEHEDSE